MLRFLIVVFLLIINTTPANADFEPPQHRWTIGYYYSDGITLHRFLGDNWEVSLGGGPDDYKSFRDSEEFRFDYDEPHIPYAETTEENKTERGFVHLGIGRKLLRENRFWLTGKFGFRYSWENYQTIYSREYFVTEETHKEERVGHRMTTTFSLSLRPAYDITSRIVLYVDFGIFFNSSTETADTKVTRYQYNETSYSTSHTSLQSERVEVFGANSITSVGFMFRF